jgi:Cu(I)/Ag(I) efflux system protein CusF
MILIDKIIRKISASSVLAVGLSIALSGAGTAFGANAVAHDTKSGADWTRAEVRKVDLERQRLTLRHERIESLDMAPMTMVFRVGEGVSTDGLSEGDTVRFQVERQMGQMVITALEIGTND